MKIGGYIFRRVLIGYVNNVFANFFFNLISVLLVLPAMPDCIVFLFLSLIFFLSSLLTEMFAHNGMEHN